MHSDPQTDTRTTMPRCEDAAPDLAKEEMPSPRRGDRAWQLLREALFLDPRSASGDRLTALISQAVGDCVRHQGSGPVYPAAGARCAPEEAAAFRIPAAMALDPGAVLSDLHRELAGSVRGGHPHMVKNIIPAASLVGIAAFAAAAPLMGNGVTGEDAGTPLLSEIAVAAGLARLVGYPREAGGIFTFGGTGTNFYGLKMGLTKACPDHRRAGIAENVVVIAPQAGHYCHSTCADWGGIGSDRVLLARAHPDQTTDMQDLERVCRRALGEGKVIGCIMVNAGTTSCFGIDDIPAAAELAGRLQREFALPYRPHVHADAVIGWAYSVFNDYAFDANPLGFDSAACARLRAIQARIAGLSAADSFGVDFHKTGFVPYNSSLVMARERRDLEALARDQASMAPLFNGSRAYDPGRFTLETSRSSAIMLATKKTLEALGCEGYQLLLGHAVENGAYLRALLGEIGRCRSLAVVNPLGLGPDTAVRAYPPGTDPAAALRSEIEGGGPLDTHDRYLDEFAAWLKERADRPDGIPFGYTKAAVFSEGGKRIAALRIYPLSPYAGREHMQELAAYLCVEKDRFDFAREFGRGAVSGRTRREGYDAVH